MIKIWEWVLIGVTAAIFIIVYILLGSWITHTLWNWVMVEVFGQKAITPYQAFGVFLTIYFLSSLFFPSKSSK
jgi:uncharacterized membrane protein